jgi:hypothetical protein
MTAQPDLWTQAAHLDRVQSKIAAAVLAFCRMRLATPSREFTMGELVYYVGYQVENVAPDSPSRILRQLRREGAVGYVVVNRRQSLYRVTGVQQ